MGGQATRDGLVRKDMAQCDGCQRSAEECESAGDGELKACADCGYSACEDCRCHACTADACNGVPRSCPCGSCRNELARLQHPTHRISWNGMQLGARGTKDVGDPSQHHNLARGTCRCPHSNFGAPYMDMPQYGPRSGQSECYIGAKGGPQYTGPRKCNAQIRREERLIALSDAGRQEESRVCQNEGCTQPGDKRCTRCRYLHVAARWAVAACGCGPHAHAHTHTQEEHASE